MRQLRKIVQFVTVSVIIVIFLFSLYESESEKNELKKNQCGRLPKEEDITIDNVIWQVFQTPKDLYKIMNAYLDERLNVTVVRVSMIGDRLNISTDVVYCQFWLNELPNTQPIVVKATQFIMMWPERYKYHPKTKLPYLVTCPIEFADQIPTAVSLTANTCDNAENKLHIINNQPPDGIKKGFGVCSKSLMFENRNFVIRFIEWAHMLKILGAEKITLFNRYVHPDLFEILNYFKAIDYVDVTPFLEPSGVQTAKFATQQNRMLEMMQHTDCFYRTRNLYKYIVVLDPDEFIMPMRPEDKTWGDLVKKFNHSQGIVSFLPRNAILAHFNKPLHHGVPDYHYMLQHTQRANISNGNVKPMFVPDTVLCVYVHFAMYCFDGDKLDSWCKWKKDVPEDLALVFHYRNELFLKSDNITFEDKTIWKYKDELISTVAETLKQTGFKP